MSVVELLWFVVQASDDVASEGVAGGGGGVLRFSALASAVERGDGEA